VLAGIASLSIRLHRAVLDWIAAAKGTFIDVRIIEDDGKTKSLLFSIIKAYGK